MPNPLRQVHAAYHAGRPSSFLVYNGGRRVTIGAPAENNRSWNTADLNIGYEATGEPVDELLETDPHRRDGTEFSSEARPSGPRSPPRVSWAEEAQEASPQPRYRRTSFGNAAETLENEHLRLLMFKRLSGWGWGEIRTPTDTHVAVLDHLGEVMLRDQDIPMRLEAESFRRESTAEGERLMFDVKSLVVQEKLRGTSFDQWMHYPLEHPCMVGQVSVTMPPDRPVMYWQYRLRATGNFCARYVRGPWLRVGEGSFGAAKNDAILPGVEWLMDEEWSSGTDWFKDPWAKRVVPHPNKVAIPFMAMSHDGHRDWPGLETRHQRHRLVQLPLSPAAGVRLTELHRPPQQPPDGPDGAGCDIEAHENQVYAEPPLELQLDQRVEFDAEIWLSQATAWRWLWTT